MNHINDIEIFQQKISQSHQIDPPDFVWENIAAHMDKKKRRMPIWIWLIGLFIGGIALFTAFNRTNHTIVARTQSNKVSTTPKDMQNNQSQIDKRTSNMISATESRANSSHTFDDDIVSKSYMNLTQAKTNKDESFENKVVSASIEMVHADNTQNTNLSSEIRTSSTIDLLEKEYHSMICQSTIPSNISPKDDIVCHDFKIKKGPKYFIELGLTLGRPIKSITGNADYHQLLGLRRHSENAWYSWGGYLHAGITLKNGLYAGLGIDYLQTKERFILISEAITKMIINFDPQTGLPIDTSFVTGSLVNKGEIRYNSVDIPLVVGYLTQHKVWNFGIEAAARYNVHFDAQGKTYNQNLNISRIENEPNMYKSNIGWSGKASFIASYNFDKSTQLLLKPYYWWQFNSINESTNPITTKWSGTGLEFGWRKIL